jgi:hypothetical protein
MFGFSTLSKIYLCAQVKFVGSVQEMLADSVRYLTMPCTATLSHPHLPSKEVVTIV